MKTNVMQRNEIVLKGMSHAELTDLPEEVMVCLRQADAEEIKNNFVKSGKVRLEETVKGHLMQNAKKNRAEAM